jgi:hypothetical protein
VKSPHPRRPTHASNIIYSYHRNGIAGTPFYAVTFDWEFNPPLPVLAGSREPSSQISDRRSFVAVWFCEFDSEGELTGDGGRFGAFEIGALPNIQFGRNSWRGDHFAEEVCAWIVEQESGVENRSRRVA